LSNLQISIYNTSKRDDTFSMVCLVFLSKNKFIVIPSVPVLSNVEEVEESKIKSSLPAQAGLDYTMFHSG